MSDTKQMKVTDWKTVSVGDFLTEDQAKRAVVLWALHGSGKAFVDAMVGEIIEPNLAEINKKLGQENNARFLAYAVEHVLLQASELQ